MKKVAAVSQFLLSANYRISVNFAQETHFHNFNLLIFYYQVINWEPENLKKDPNKQKKVRAPSYKAVINKAILPEYPNEYLRFFPSYWRNVAKVVDVNT